MSKPLAFFVIAFLWAGSIRAQSQTPASLQNTVWKFYVQGLNDSLTMHFGADTSWSTATSGETIVRSLWKQSNDTLRINDIDGTYPCHDGQGIYRFVIDGDSMNWILVSDPCADRAGALSDMKFIRAKS